MSYHRKAMCILTNPRHSSAEPDLALLLSHPLHFLSLGLGSGLIPKAPGTAGTLLGFPLFWMIMDLPLEQQWLALLLMFLFGIWCCAFTGKTIGVSDHGAIVWDEIVAMAAILVTVPFTWTWWLAAFMSFRLFDIWKPFPISWADRHIGGGLGVMLDDGLAAAMAILVLQLFQGWL